MIETDALSRHFELPGGELLRALDSVTFRVPRGGVMGILGPNGAGKTTLLRVLSGLLRPHGGRARIGGFDLAAQAGQARARVGLLTQEAGLPERLTPLWHVALHASLRGFPREEALRRARRLLEEMDLGSAMGRPCALLSAGSRTKVALARALVHHPPALLLDEPAAHLDIEATAWLRRTIAGRARQGAAVLLSTHNAAEAERLCDEVVILGRGRVLARERMDVLGRRGGGPGFLERAYLRLQRGSS